MKKLSKIMAIVVTLTVLASLFAFAVPVSAGTLAWSSVTLPRTTINQLVAAVQDVNAVAISPNYATDKTVFAGSTDATGAFLVVYRSTNGGYTWSAMTTPATTVGFAGTKIVTLKVSPNYTNDKTVFVSTDTTVYRSTDGGATFSQLGVVTLAGVEVITSMDVAPNYDGVGVIAVGVGDPTAATFATQANSVQAWGVSGALTWTSIAPAASTAGTDVVAVKYSPSYPVDSTLLVVTTDAGTAGGGDMATAAPYLRARVGTVWDTALLPTAIGATAVTDFVSPYAGTGVFQASIATPSDYNASASTTRRVYVAIVAGGGYTVTDSNIYRVTGAGATANIGVLNPSVEIGDIVYSGTYASGILVGGLFTTAALTPSGAQVYRTTNPVDAAASVLWNAATNAPTGEMGASTTVKLAIDPNFATSKIVVAGTSGADSAFAVSSDGSASIFNETGLIDNGAAALATIGDVVLSTTYATDSSIFMVTNAAGGSATNDTSFWKTTDAGTTWSRLFLANFTTAGIGVITLSPAFATDSSLWVGDVGGTAIQYSADKGASWAARTSTIAIADMAAADANTIYVAGAGVSVVKSVNNAWTWSTKSTGSTGANLTSIVVKGSTVVVGDNAGSVFRSDDASVTWAKVGATAGAGNMLVDVDGTQVYAVDAGTGDAYRYPKSSTDATWLTLTTTPLLGAGIKVTADKTLYELDPSAVANTQVYRTLVPESTTAPTFEWIAGLNAATAAGAMSVVPGTTGNVIAVAWGATVQLYSDTLSAGSPPPTITGPVNNYNMDRPNLVTFSIDNSANPLVTSWDIQISTDPNFVNNAAIVTQVPPATQLVVNIATTITPTDGTIYWRTRATLGSPLRGPFSASRTINPQLTIAPNFPTQVQPVGATAVNTPVTPVFNWGSFKFATGYEFQISKDASFTTVNLVVDLTGAKALGNVTSYVVTTPLAYSTAYYWRVRAITSTGTATDWSPGVGFATAAQPAPPTTPQPPVTIPPQPTPTLTVVIPTPTTVTTQVTPAWIYAIIAIGAILVIAVIVLIVRTRRPV